MNAIKPLPMTALSREFVEFVHSDFGENVPLHAPTFGKQEVKSVVDAIESTFVSTVGEYVNAVENQIKELVKSNFVIATMNGTAALHLALRIVGVQRDCEVLTQPLSFVATTNAIAYLGAAPVFVDIDEYTLGLNPIKLSSFLHEYGEVNNGRCFNKKTGKRIAACVPMHTFGFPVDIDAICTICEEYCIPVVEDSAESLGSLYHDQHTGTFGKVGIFSFNGNKIVTAGAGGAIVTDDEELATQAKYLSTTAKQPHRWEYHHDEVGYNYRMSNLNAALLSAQLNRLETFLEIKRKRARKYAEFFSDTEINFVEERDATRANYWLCTIVLPTKSDRDDFLEYTNNHNVMTRPAWTPLHQLPMYRHCMTGDLTCTENLAGRIVNIPSSGYDL